MTTVDATDARLSTHEAVCAERYTAITIQFSAANARLKRIEQIMISAGVAVIAGFGAIIMMLIQIINKG